MKCKLLVQHVLQQQKCRHLFQLHHVYLSLPIVQLQLEVVHYCLLCKCTTIAIEMERFSRRCRLFSSTFRLLSMPKDENHSEMLIEHHE